MRGRRVETALTGEHRSIFRGRGMEFDQVVRFAFGDDIRDVDWNVTARLGEVYRKVFIEDREASVAVVFADDPSLQFGSGVRSKRDALLELAGLVMLLGVLNRERVTLIHERPEGALIYPPARRRDRIMATAGALFSATPPDPLIAGACSPLIRQNIPRGSLIIWIGEVPNAPPPPEWGGWTRRHPIIGVRAEDMWEREGHTSAQLIAYDPVAGRVVELRDDPATRERHAVWRADRDARWRAWWPDPADRLTIGPDEDPLAGLTHFMRSRHARSPGRAS